MRCGATMLENDIDIGTTYRCDFLPELHWPRIKISKLKWR